MSPQRIQRRRIAGWRMPTGAVYVGRPTRWGNPYDWRTAPHWVTPDVERRRQAVVIFDSIARYRTGDDGSYPAIAEIRRDLAEKDLACWCPLDQPCHADVLLEIANSPEETPAP